MSRAIVIGIIALFACGVAQATSYEWAAGAGTKTYDDASAWTPSAVPGAGDSIHIGGVGNTGTVQFVKATTMSLGAITIDNGILQETGTGTLAVSGDFLVQNSGKWLATGSLKTLDVGGNVRIVTPNDANCYHWTSLTMRGSGATLDARGVASPWINVTVADCASVSMAATNTIKMMQLAINGTITGGTWTVAVDRTDTGPCYVAFGPNGSMTAGTLVIDQVSNGVPNQSISVGGGTYPAFTIIDSNGGAALVNRTIRLKGNVTVTSDFAYDTTFAGYITEDRTVINTDNGSGKISNFTVNGNFRIGQNLGAGGSLLEYSGVVANTSTVTIGGAATFDRFAYIKGGTSTWNFGGNVSFTTNYRFDNSDLKTTTFNINGAGAQSLDFGNAIPTGKKLPLGNLVINKLHGIAALADNVLLTGNFRLQSGGLSNTGNYWINMQGGKGTWGTAETFENDNSLVNIRRLYVKQGSPTWVKLNSNLTITDNLDVDPNCILFTNGFTLSVTGGLDQGTYGPSSLAYTTREGGLILVSGVPEPATLMLAGSGALGLFAWARRRRMK